MVRLVWFLTRWNVCLGVARDVDEPAAPSARPAAAQEPSRGRSWLAPHIMVKVVDKSLSEGRRAPALASDASAHALRDT